MLGSTSLWQLDAAGLREVKARVPQLRRLVVQTAPANPLPGLEVVAWQEWSQNPWGL